jgi:hypothetical protein
VPNHRTLAPKTFKAFNLSKAGWSWGCVAAIDSNGRTIWIADAHRDDGKHFFVQAEEKLTARFFAPSGTRGELDQVGGEKKEEP